MKKRFGNKLAAVVLGFALAATGAASVGSSSAHAASATDRSANAQHMIQYGERFMGVRYDFGAPSGTTNRFDCSSFTQYVFGHFGIDLPRTSKAQSRVGKYVPRSQLQPGDLVFFYSPIHHVGIYMGNGKVLHTYGKPGVTISDLDSGAWSHRYATARRVL